MEDANRAKQLELENLELKKEVEVLFQTVVQLKESLNLLVNRYVVNESNLEKWQKDNIPKDRGFTRIYRFWN